MKQPIKLYTIEDVANILGMTHGNFYQYVYYRETLPAPTFQIGKRHVYDEEGMKAVVVAYHEHRKAKGSA